MEPRNAAEGGSILTVCRYKSRDQHEILRVLTLTSLERKDGAC